MFTSGGVGLRIPTTQVAELRPSMLFFFFLSSASPASPDCTCLKWFLFCITLYVQHSSSIKQSMQETVDRDILFLIPWAQPPSSSFSTFLLNTTISSLLASGLSSVEILADSQIPEGCLGGGGVDSCSTGLFCAEVAVQFSGAERHLEEADRAASVKWNPVGRKKKIQEDLACFWKNSSVWHSHIAIQLNSRCDSNATIYVVHAVYSLSPPFYNQDQLPFSLQIYGDFSFVHCYTSICIWCMLNLSCCCEAFAYLVLHCTLVNGIIVVTVRCKWRS